jgi:transcriptional regulator with XRE-family HTH domain
LAKKGDNYIIIKRLSELRNKKNLTQEDVADMLGVARTTYAMYEQGKREMDYEALLKLANYYKVSLDYLFDRSDIPIHPESYSSDEIEFVTRSLILYKELKERFK